MIVIKNKNNKYYLILKKNEFIFYAVEKLCDGLVGK
jgi:hypothetical protein